MNGRVDNVMTIDSWWNEIEYGVPIRRAFDPWESDGLDSEWDDMEVDNGE